MPIVCYVSIKNTSYSVVMSSGGPKGVRKMRTVTKENTKSRKRSERR
jgi:hypothetical protein